MFFWFLGFFCEFRKMASLGACYLHAIFRNSQKNTRFLIGFEKTKVNLMFLELTRSNTTFSLREELTNISKAFVLLQNSMLPNVEIEKEGVRGGLS